MDTGCSDGCCTWMIIVLLMEHFADAVAQLWVSSDLCHDHHPSVIALSRGPLTTIKTPSLHMLQIFRQCEASLK